MRVNFTVRTQLRPANARGQFVAFTQSTHETEKAARREAKALYESGETFVYIERVERTKIATFGKVEYERGKNIDITA